MARSPVESYLPPGVRLSPLLTIRGIDAAHKYVNEVLGVPIRRHTFVLAVRSGKVFHKKIGGSLYFSTQGLFNWASSFTEAAS
jgi:hypothetical protein